MGYVYCERQCSAVFSSREACLGAEQTNIEGRLKLHLMYGSKNSKERKGQHTHAQTKLI